MERSECKTVCAYFMHYAIHRYTMYERAKQSTKIIIKNKYLHSTGRERSRDTTTGKTTLMIVNVLTD
jgi:hypothetical protein